MFPTILESLDFTLDDHRAGLGVSLLGDQETLVERHGLDTLNERLREETALQHRLWEGLAPQRRDTDSTTSQEQVIETPADRTEEVDIMR